MGASPTPPASSPPLWARGKAVCLPRCLPGHGMEARLVRPDSALMPPPLWDAGAGGGLPLVGKDAIGLVLVPGLAFDPSGGRLGQGGGFMTAGWRITPAVPPPCAGRRCCCPKSPAPPMTGGGAGAHRARPVPGGCAEERGPKAPLLAGRYVNGSAAAVVAPAVVVAATVAAAATAAPAAAAAAAKDDDNQDDPQAAAAVAAAPTIVTTAHS